MFAQVPQPLWVFQAGHLRDLVDTNAFIEPLHQYRVADHLGPDARRWLRLDRLAGLQDQIPADKEQRSHGDLGGLLGDEKAGEWVAVAGVDRRILGARSHSLQAFEHVALGEPEQQGIANALHSLRIRCPLPVGNIAAKPPKADAKKKTPVHLGAGTPIVTKKPEAEAKPLPKAETKKPSKPAPKSAKPAPKKPEAQKQAPKKPEAKPVPAASTTDAAPKTEA